MADGPLGLFDAMDELRRQGAAAERRRIRRAIASALRILTECRKQRLPPRKYDIDTIDAATRAPKRRSRGWKAIQATDTAKATP